MNIVVLGAKGSAVTTSALSLAAGWPGAAPVIFVEADGTGGDVAGWFDLPASPNLMTAATGLHLPAADGLLEHTQSLPGGLRVIAAPLRGPEVTGALADVSRSILAPLRGGDDVTLVIDAGHSDGRNLPSATTHADLVVVVIRQDFRSAPTTLARCVHAQHLVEALAARSVPVVAVLVGDRPYADTEIAGFLGVDVVGVIEDDPHGAAFVGGRPTSKRFASRARLATSAGKVANALAMRLQVAALTAPFGETTDSTLQQVAS
jgi:MinD-like ATPase involved in chromosome partitioning or flagellar assembly